jgi:hypothetical protein
MHGDVEQAALPAREHRRQAFQRHRHEALAVEPVQRAALGGDQQRAVGQPGHAPRLDDAFGDGDGAPALRGRRRAGGLQLRVRGGGQQQRQRESAEQVRHRRSPEMVE